MRLRRNARSPHTRVWLALLVGALIAAGCGGGDSDDDSAGDVDPGSEATGDGADEPDAAGDDGSDDEAADDGSSNAAGSAGDAAPGTATVTIGGTTYVGTEQVVCIDLGGAIGGSWNDAAGEIAISIDLPPPGWEDSPDDWTPPAVRVDDDSDPNTPRQFQANPEMATMLSLPGSEASSVSSYSIDGTSAAGTAVFVEFFESMAALSSGDDAPAPVEGTFALSCE